MSELESTHGLACPQCGGIIPVPEGQALVKCPYCELRSFVRGERGLRRYQVAQRVDRQAILEVLRRFFSSNWAIARDAGRLAQVSEAFLVYLPFWTVWGRAAAWAFGEKKVGSGEHKHYEPREVRIVQEMSWNGAACDVGEFGVNQVPLSGRALDPFNPDGLHTAGMVFEPVNSYSDAQQAADNQFQSQVRGKSGLDRIAQLFVRFFRRRSALVYYPLWVLRYLYRGRSFQVVVDGASGEVLYGKGPGNTLYRAAILVGGMALGAFTALDIPAGILALSGRDSDSGTAGAALVAFVIGLGIMGFAYRAFRFGEQYEYHSDSSGRSGAKILESLANPLQIGGGEGSGPDLPVNFGSIDVKDIEKWVNRLS